MRKMIFLIIHGLKQKKHKINTKSIINEEYISKMNNIIKPNEVSIFDY